MLCTRSETSKRRETAKRKLEKDTEPGNGVLLIREEVEGTFSTCWLPFEMEGCPNRDVVTSYRSKVQFFVGSS